ncbi:MAG: flap structure-specific endonuclease, partial [Promethearchaeota archaeon]
MGVKLHNLIIRKKLDFSDLAGTIIAIDAPNIIMSLFNFVRKNSDGSPAGLILDRTQRPISHLYGLLYRINFYYSKKIFPLFCFDGKVSELKKLITKDQLNDYLFTQKWYQSALRSGNNELARKIALSKEYLWQNIIQESKQLLNNLGVPYFDSPASAESQCAQLVRDKIAHYSNSQDFDSLVFGCPHLVQNISKSLRRKVHGKWTYQKIIPYKINLKENLHSLGIDQFQLVDMVILMGCDYFPGVRGIGPKKALNLIKKFHSLEKVI